MRKKVGDLAGMADCYDRYPLARLSDIVALADFKMRIKRHSMGLVLFGLGDMPGAIRHYEDALRLRGQLGDPYAESEGCKSLGTAYLRCALPSNLCTYPNSEFSDSLHTKRINAPPDLDQRNLFAPSPQSIQSPVYRGSREQES